MHDSLDIAIVVSVVLAALLLLLLLFLKRDQRKMRELYANQPVCPDCGEFASSSRLRAALCQNPCHREATDRRIARLRDGENND
jgi:hypothetical protein